MNLHLWLLLGYAAGIVLLGLWIGRRVRTSGDFFVAGRRLGPGLLFSTMVAANIGAGSTVGAAGLGYRDGLSAWWWVGSAAIGSVVLAFTVGPRIRREAERHGLHTVGDYLEHRYGRAVRGIVAALLWVGTLAILAGQLVALAWVLEVVAGIPKVFGCIVGGLVMTTYFTAGGLLTSAWVNLVQLVVMVAGFALALPLAMAHAGGWDAVQAATPGGPFWSPWKGGASGWNYLALLGPAFVISPGLLQKIYGARDDRAVRKGVAANALVLLAFAFVPPLLGIVARAQHPGLANHELALPTILMYDLPPLLGSLGLAAVVSAEVSSADAILFMLSTSLSRDLYRRFVDPGASDARVLAVARWAAVVGGTLGVLLAIVSPTVIGALSIFYTLLGVCLFVPVVAGLYVRRVGTPEALAAIAAGVSLMLATHVGTDGRGFGALSPALVGLAAAGLACALVAIGRRAYDRAPEAP
ncbi:MAG TPA: sodium:solute symporter family protein [Vicinamibacteria bacterium]|nr:sodium:solute symporter family protein [Vicinamibacteria bacterium]